MRLNITDRGSIPKTKTAEPSGICVVVRYHSTQEVCPLCGSELASIMRKALNA